LIGWHDCSLTSEGDLLAEDAWDCDNQSREEENTHNDEREDPLECNDLDEELADSDGGCQDAQSKAHSIILEYNKEESTIDQDTPNGNIG